MPKVELTWKRTGEGIIVAEHKGVRYVVADRGKHWVLKVDGKEVFSGSKQQCKAQAMNLTNKKNVSNQEGVNKKHKPKKVDDWPKPFGQDPRQDAETIRKILWCQDNRVKTKANEGLRWPDMRQSDLDYADRYTKAVEEATGVKIRRAPTEQKEDKPKGNDPWGFRLGTRAAKVNAAINDVPKTGRQIEEETGTHSISGHLHCLLKRKLIKRVPEGMYVRAKD